MYHTESQKKFPTDVFFYLTIIVNVLFIISLRVDVLISDTLNLKVTKRGDCEGFYVFSFFYFIKKCIVRLRVMLDIK